MRSWTMKLSWVVLFILGLLISLGSIASIAVAYFSQTDQVGDLTLEEIRSMNPGLATSIQARRSTAAAWALAFGMLFSWVAAMAFRAKERWARWALLVPLATACVVMTARVWLLSITLGAGTAIAILVVLAVGVAISYRDF